jgi:hypothetical protein
VIGLKTLFPKYPRREMMAMTRPIRSLLRGTRPPGERG